MKFFIYLITSLLFSVNLEAKVLHSWSQLKAKHISFRVIIDDNQCPSLKLNDQPLAMTIRHTPTDNFPVTTCEIELDTSTTATFNDKPIPTVQKPQKILVIGDTGCGGKINQYPDRFQDCSDPNQWIFPKLISNAMKLKPDLIIHTGDLHYRQEQCTNNLSECYGDKNGMGYGTWKAEFLDPMAKLLETTPIILTRGNHDSCKYSWEGWGNFFSNIKVSNNCKNIEPQYIVRLDNANVLVIDSSSASEIASDHQHVKLYKQYIHDALLNLVRDNKKFNILLSHKPVYSSVYGDLYKIDKSYNVTLFEAIKNISMKNVDLTLHGHIHNFNLTKFYDPLIPTQVVVGNSGNIIYSSTLANASYKSEPLIELELVHNNSGFAIINLNDQEITLQYFDVNGNEIGNNILFPTS